MVIRLLILLITLSSCSQKITGEIIEISYNTPHFVIQTGEYRYKIVKTSLEIRDTLKIGQMIEFKHKRRNCENGCLKYGIR